MGGKRRSARRATFLLSCFRVEVFEFVCVLFISPFYGKTPQRRNVADPSRNKQTRQTLLTRQRQTRSDHPHERDARTPVTRPAYPPPSAYSYHRGCISASPHPLEVSFCQPATLVSLPPSLAPAPHLDLLPSARTFARIFASQHPPSQHCGLRRFALTTKQPTTKATIHIVARAESARRYHNTTIYHITDTPSRQYGEQRRQTTGPGAAGAI